MSRCSHPWLPRTAAGMTALGVNASLLTHVVAAGAILLLPWNRLWPDWDSDPATLAGRKGVILIQVEFADPEPPPAIVEIPPSDEPVVVTPLAARIEERTMVATPSINFPSSSELADLAAQAQLAAQAPPTKAHAEPRPQPQVTTHSAPRVPRAPSAPPMTVGFEEAASFAGNAPPQYPDQAHQNGWAGTVLLRLWVDASGRVTKVQVEQSSGYAVLDASAVNAVRHWRGQPARRDGRPVATEEILPVTFRIPGR